MEEDKKNENITKKDLEEQTQILLTAFDERFNKIDVRFNKIDVRFKGMDIRFNAAATRMDEMESKLEEVESNLGKKIDKLQISIDGYVKTQEDFKGEHVIIKEEVKQMKKVFKDKLGVEIRAI